MHDGIEAMAQKAAEQAESYDSTKDRNVSVERGVFYDGKRDNLFDKGHSKRLWGELYKVIDSSDVVIQVLDARDPQGITKIELRGEKSEKKSMY